MTDRYLHIGRAADLTGPDRVLYRFFEMVPALLSLGTLALFVILSFVAPTIVAYCTIAFSAFWLFKTIFLFVHLRHNFRRLMHHMQVDWMKRLETLKHDDIVHLVVFPFYKESYEVIAESVRAVARSRYPTGRIAVVLATEELAGARAAAIAERVRAEFAGGLLDIIVTVHPEGQPGETPGKGSNISYAAREAVRRIVDSRDISHEKVIVSAFDSDTVVYKDYFSCLTWNFLTAERPLRTSFQPVPLYNNNIWSAPALSRVLAYSSTFWQMIQQERPERLSTFSSHAVPLPPLEEAGYWQSNMVNEDSRIFWNLFIYFDGDYSVVPLSYPVSMDANVAPTFWGTVMNLYKQHRRWSYGAENIPYLLFNFIKNPRIALGKKLRIIFVHLEGFWSLVVQPLILFVFGWLPLLVGGAAFNASVLSYNLPVVSSWFLALATAGLIGLSVYALRLIPERPKGYTRWASIVMALQWILVPLTMVTFSSIPGLDAQIRLMTGRYLGFWTTPKLRKHQAPSTKSQTISNSQI
jgi:hypothetical protein